MYKDIGSNEYDVTAIVDIHKKLNALNLGTVKYMISHGNSIANIGDDFSNELSQIDFEKIKQIDICIRNKQWDEVFYVKISFGEKSFSELSYSGFKYTNYTKDFKNIASIFKTYNSFIYNLISFSSAFCIISTVMMLISLFQPNKFVALAAIFPFIIFIIFALAQSQLKKLFFPNRFRKLSTLQDFMSIS